MRIFLALLLFSSPVLAQNCPPQYLDCEIGHISANIPVTAHMTCDAESGCTVEVTGENPSEAEAVYYERIYVPGVGTVYSF